MTEERSRAHPRESDLYYAENGEGVPILLIHAGGATASTGSCDLAARRPRIPTNLDHGGAFDVARRQEACSCPSTFSGR